MDIIEFNKWMTSYADGFEIMGELIKHVKSGQILGVSKITNWYFYSLLIVRAVEGWNREEGYIKIVQGWTYEDGNHVTISDMKSFIPFKTWSENKGNNLDNSRKQALKYVYNEQMKQDNS